jgi:flagellar biosynthesis/type III secretory pathway protein FliH
VSTADYEVTLRLSELNDQLAEARKSGHEEGVREGYDEGYDEGNSSGWDDGYSSGEDAGYEKAAREFDEAND